MVLIAPAPTMTAADGFVDVELGNGTGAVRSKAAHRPKRTPLVDPTPHPQPVHRATLEKPQQHQLQHPNSGSNNTERTPDVWLGLNGDVVVVNGGVPIHEFCQSNQVRPNIAYDSRGSPTNYMGDSNTTNTTVDTSGHIADLDRSDEDLSATRSRGKWAKRTSISPTQPSLVRMASVATFSERTAATFSERRRSSIGDFTLDRPEVSYWMPPPVDVAGLGDDDDVRLNILRVDFRCACFKLTGKAWQALMVCIFGKPMTCPRHVVFDS